MEKLVKVSNLMGIKVLKTKSPMVNIFTVKLAHETSSEGKPLPAKGHYLISLQLLFYCFCIPRRDHSPPKSVFDRLYFLELEIFQICNFTYKTPARVENFFGSFYNTHV